MFYQNGRTTTTDRPNKIRHAQKTKAQLGDKMCRTGICVQGLVTTLIIIPVLSYIGLITTKTTPSNMQTSALFSSVKLPVGVKARYTENPATVNNPNPMATNPKWAQKTVTLPPLRRGCHLITPKIVREIGQDLSEFKCGLAHLFLQHTSASLTINENYDSDVRDDTETFLNKIVPEGRSAPWKHTLEGPDDMPAHIKSSMFGCTLTIPITDGKLNMGTWQGIWLCEHRDAPTPRKVVVTLNGI